jgi:hypothetical protein
MKFLSQINVNTEYTLPTVDGTNGQVLTTDGSGAAYWGSVGIGALNLDGLQDVVITTPTSGQILRYGIPVGSGDQNPVWYNWTPNFVTTASAVTITGTQTITGSKTFTAATTVSIASGNDVALTITKGGSHEALYINKTSGSGNAVTIVGTLQATTIVKTGGTASQFLKADGSVDTNTYLTSYTETQTLDAVTDLGSTTTNAITVGGLTSTSVTTSLVESSGLLIIDADNNGTLQPDQGDPAVPVLSFDWQGSTQGYIDTDGKITFNGFKTPSGTSSQFLKANGTVDSNTYVTSTALDAYATIDYVDDEITGVITYIGSNFVPNTRTLTINGTALDLSADRSWTISSADGYISDVRLSESTLEFTGEGSAFTGNIDLSTLPFAPEGSYLTAEADTLQSVTTRGSSTTTGATFGGNVGIGTTSPTATLDARIAGTTSGAVIKVGNVGSGDFGGLAVSDGGTYPVQLYGSSLAFLTGNSAYASATEKVRITSAGNVGIGTTSPGATLHLDASGGANIRLQRSSASSNRFDVGTDGTNMEFSVRDEGAFTFGGGNVGIGTTAPAQKLHVYEASGSSQAYLLVQNNRARNAAVYTKTTVGGFYAGTSIGTDSLCYQIYDDTAGERLRITSDGSLLVGATNADVGGSVKGAIIRQDGSIVAARNIAEPFHYQTPISADRMNTMGDGIMYSMWREGIFQAGIGATNTSNMTFFTGDNTSASERMRITSAGNVGIGTTSPLSPLHQVGGGVAYTGEARFGGSSTAFGIELKYSQAGATSGSIYVSPTYNSADVLFKLGAGLGNTNQLVLQGNGNVGIGTTSPGAKLHVDAGGIRVTGTTSTTGQIDASPNFGAFRFYDGTTFRGGLGMGQWAGVGAATDIVQYLSSGVNYHISNTTNPVLTVSSGGNVGIGTTGPSTKLDVNGVITATGGNSTNWNTAYGWGNHVTAGYFKLEGEEPITIQAETVTFTGSVTVEGTFTESSSIRFKENITPLDPALDKVNQLEAVSYNKIGVDDREIGLIAEDVAELFPEVVTYNEEGQPQGIQYQRLSVILLKAVQELSQEVNELKKKLN